MVCLTPFFCGVCVTTLNTNNIHHEQGFRKMTVVEASKCTQLQATNFSLTRILEDIEDSVLGTRERGEKGGERQGGKIPKSPNFILINVGTPCLISPLLC